MKRILKNTVSILVIIAALGLWGIGAYDLFYLKNWIGLGEMVAGPFVALILGALAESFI